MYAFRSSHGPVELAFTDRYGGVSAAPFDELNLARVGGDDTAALEANLERVRADFAPDAGLAPAMEQPHGCDVAHIELRDTLMAEQTFPCDGEVTDDADLVLVVRVADCVPVLLADGVAGVIGVAHAGRRGVAAAVVPNVVERMRELGARQMHAWVGPHICGGCYEVPEEMQEEVATKVPESRATTTWGTPSLDLGAAVRAQLESAEVVVTDVARCTRESEDLYSFRRDGDAAGRSAGLIRLRSHG